MILNRNVVGGVLLLVLLIFFLYNIRNLILEYEKENLDEIAQMVNEKEAHGGDKIKK